ncbi:MAG: polysaccharide biosynthesis C-terminal domain-containing protein [Pseudomonadota bacterium]
MPARSDPCAPPVPGDGQCGAPMKGPLQALVFGYGSATLVQGVVGFLAVPFLLAILGPRAFAQWAMLEPLVAVLAGFALVGVHYGHLHGISTGLLTPAAALRQVAGFGVAPAALVALGGAVAAATFVVGGKLAPVATLCVAYVVLEAAILLLQFQSRALSDAFAFAATVWLRSGGIALGLLAFKYAGARLALTHYLAFMIALDLAVLGVACWRHRPLLAAMLREGPPVRESYLCALRYGLPIMLAGGFAMLVSNGDRYVVHALMPAEQLPAYVVMAKLAGAMSFVMAPLNLWWPVARHRHMRDGDGGAGFFANAMPLLLAYYLMAAAALWVASGQLVRWYAPSVHGYDGLSMSLLLGGGVALGMTVPANIGMLAPGKTHWLLVSVALSACVGLGLAFALVPRLGFVGAALSTLLAQWASLGSVYLISQRLYPLPIGSARLAGIAAGGVATMVLLWLASASLLAQVIVCATTCVLMAALLRPNFDALRNG